MYAVLEVEEVEFGLSRGAVLKALHAENVIARRYFYPGTHRVMPYMGARNWDLPHTDALSSQVLQLPIGAPVTDEHAKRIACLLRQIQANAQAVAVALGEQS